MTATDELRRLLDERGVKWEDDSPVPSMKQWKTSFTSFTGEEVSLGCYEEPKWIMGTLVFHTPEQAIEATLGGVPYSKPTVLSDLQAENDKLRELVRDMWRELDAATQYDAGGGRGAVYEFADRMRELGVEV